MTFRFVALAILGITLFGQETKPASQSGPANIPKPTLATKPLTKSEVITLLQVGTPTEKIERLVKQRGIAFRITPDVSLELSKSGANTRLMDMLNTVQPNHAPVATPPKKPVTQRALVPEKKN